MTLGKRNLYFNRWQVIFLSVNYPVRQETVVAYTNVTLNHDIGVLVGNFCGPAVVNISGNYFTYGRYIGLEVLSCWRDTNLEGVAPGDMMLQIGHNHFMHNEAVATRCDQWTVLLSCSNIYLPIFSKFKNRLSWTFFCRVGPELQVVRKFKTLSFHCISRLFFVPKFCQIF